MGRTSTICRRTCSSGNRARPSRNLPMSSRNDFGRRADGPTKSNQSSHSSHSCSSGCSFNSPSRFGAARTRWSLRALARVAISASPKSSKSSGQVIGLWPRGCSGYLWQVGIEKGSRRPLDLLRCPLGRKGVADFPPLRVCQVNVTQITRKIFKILNLVFGNLSFFSGRFSVLFVRTWNAAQNWGRQTGPLSRKVSRQIDHRSPWSGRQKYFLVANGD